MADHELVDEVFSGDAELAKRVHHAMRDHPADAPLFLEIAKYIRALRSRVAAGRSRAMETTEPSMKRRKLQNGSASLVDGEALLDHQMKVMFEARDLSFSIPVRKKLHLEIAQAISSTSGHLIPVYQARARNPASGELEYKVGLQSFKHALRLPVPEKTQKQHNFVLLPEGGLGIGEKPLTSDISPQDPLVWTVSDGPQKVITFSDDEPDKDAQVHDGGLIDQTLNRCLEKTVAGKLIEPDETEFASARPEAHRKGERAYHVKAFRGSKDGYLFFLATGIFFGFKKPLAFFPFEAINSISYTSVLQRTFNLNIAVQLPDQAEIKEHEFSMIDQADFAGIDTYIKQHGLQDASLAESRKAKQLHLNGVKKGSEEAAVEGGEQQSELQKAQQDIEDAEDEEEEDYDPGSEGFSDGSGDSSVQEYEDGDATGDDGNLVVEELGSEAEEVVPDPNDEEQL